MEYQPCLDGRLEGTVMVVEDTLSLRQLMLSMLGKIVHEVRAVEDGARGLALWNDWRPDVVVTDIQMPNMDGLMMSQAIKNIAPEAQIIVVTSHSDNEHLRKAIEIGIDRYVLKPVDGHLLIDAIRKCLRDTCRHRELWLAKLVFEHANEGMLVTDRSLRILSVNSAFSEISGYRRDEVLGKSPSILSSGQHDAGFYRSMWESLRSLGRWEGEVINRRKNGEIYAEWLSIVASEEPYSGQTRYIGLFTDITQRKREDERIRRLAHFDPLTGLPNRILFGDHLRRALSCRGAQLALLYIDLDRFKSVNDLYGHTLGDHLLIEVTRRMSACLRDCDTVSRHGGDEFLVLLESDEIINAASRVSQELIDIISKPYSIENRELHIGASIGVAVYPKDGLTAQELLDAADAALYIAKNEGRGDFRFYRHEDQTAAEVRLSLVASLRSGLDEGRFVARFLPEISLHSGKVERLELLLRFEHPERGLLNAEAFINVAEQLGLMHQIGINTLSEAANAFSSMPMPTIGLSVDLSLKQLLAVRDDPTFIDRLRETGLPPNRITFECPESNLDNNQEAQEALIGLSQAGCGCVLDDFGAGFCSFTLLQQLPLNGLKIDKSIVAGMKTSQQSRDLAAALIAFAKRMNLRVVAEGVDEASQLAYLRENGCDGVQGYLFGQPLTVNEISAYLRQGGWLDGPFVDETA